MKKLLLVFALLLPACSLFSEIPPNVVQGQRTAYQGVLLAEQNDEMIISEYARDCKAAITYHFNFVYEPKIQALRENPSLNKEQKSLQITQLENERDAQIAAAFVDIEKKAKSMYEKAMANHTLTKKLMESVYNYMSTTPISVDNIEFWVDKFKKLVNKQD